MWPISPALPVPRRRPSEHQTTAHPGADEHPEKVPEPAAGAMVQLADHRNPDVVVHGHRHPFEGGFDGGAERDLLHETRDVRRLRDRPGLGVHRAGGADAHRPQVQHVSASVLQGDMDAGDDLGDEPRRSWSGASRCGEICPTTRPSLTTTAWIFVPPRSTPADRIQPFAGHGSRPVLRRGGRHGWGLVGATAASDSFRTCRCEPKEPERGRLVHSDPATQPTFTYRGQRFLWGYSPDRLICGLWEVGDATGLAQRTWPISEHEAAWGVFRSIEPHAVAYEELAQVQTAVAGAVSHPAPAASLSSQASNGNHAPAPRVEPSTSAPEAAIWADLSADSGATPSESADRPVDPNSCRRRSCSSAPSARC